MLRHARICQKLPPADFLRISVPARELARDSEHSMLGIGSTLPQQRLGQTALSSAPQQYQYPMWCFFCGALAESTLL